MRRRSGRAGTRAPRGVTLIELVIAMAISGVLLGLGVPAYQDWIAARQLDNHARRLADALTLARTEAIRHNLRVNVCKSADGRHCTGRGGWDAGFLMHVDEDADGDVDPGEEPLRREPRAPDGITIAANAPLDDYVSFTALGHARQLTGALQMGTFTVCKSGREAVLVVLAHSGRVRVDRARARCP
jgi:type IV fimbrial biogenesis protein FimT